MHGSRGLVFPRKIGTMERIGTALVGGGWWGLDAHIMSRSLRLESLNSSRITVQIERNTSSSCRSHIDDSSQMPSDIRAASDLFRAATGQSHRHASAQMETLMLYDRCIPSGSRTNRKLTPSPSPSCVVRTSEPLDCELVWL